MSAESCEDAAAEAVAEEILRTIYGDDYKGCTVRLETIAAIVADALKQRLEAGREILGLYEKAMEALHLLSTPPAATTHLVPAQLPELLGGRLDSIHQLTRRLIDAAAVFKTGTSISTHSI